MNHNADGITINALQSKAPDIFGKTMTMDLRKLSDRSPVS